MNKWNVSVCLCTHVYACCELNGISPKDILKFYPLVPENGNLFGNKTFVDVSKLKWKLSGWALSQHDWCSYKKRKVLYEDRDTQRQRSEWCGCKPRTAKDGQRWTVTTRCKEAARKDSGESLRGSMALLTSWFQTSRLQNCERINWILRHVACSTLLWKP